MGTAVLHPKDYLAAPQSDLNSHFFGAADYPPPFVRSKGGPLHAGYEAAIPVTKPGKHGALCNKARENPSTGLLPPPEQAMPSAHNMCHRLVPRISACGFPQIAGSRGIKQARRPTVPIFNHTTPSERISSEQSPLYGVQPHERRLLQCDARFPLNSATSCQRLKSFASPHFHDALNPDRLQRAGSFDPTAQYRKSMHPVEICSDRQRLCAKPLFKVLPEGRQKLHFNSNSVGVKSNVCKQLKRSASAKVQEGSETPNFRRPAFKHDEKLVTSLSEGAVGKSGSRRYDLKPPTSSAPPTPPLGGKIERGPETPVPLSVDSRGRMFAVNADVARSSQATMPQQMVGMTRNVSASSFGRGSVSDNDELWVSMMNDERCAGPFFFNSPSPRSLPVPSFAFLFSRAPSTGSEPTSSAGCNAHVVSDKSSSQASYTWDVAPHVALATKDLRRMLRLDNASLDT